MGAVGVAIHLGRASSQQHVQHCTHAHNVDVALLLGVPCARCRVSLGVNHEERHKTVGAPLHLERGAGEGAGVCLFSR